MIGGMAKKWSPFLWISFFWLAFAGAWCWRTGGAFSGTWMLALGLLCLINLLSLSQSIAVVLALISDNHSSNLPARVIQAAFWGTLKFLSLGLLALTLMKSRMAPEVAVVLGISTMLVVPLVGGLWWSQREFKHAS